MQEIQEKMRSRIESLGFKVEMFANELFDGYKDLDDAGIQITDNLIHPGISTGFFGIYCQFIVNDPDTKLQPSLPYLRAGMTFLHCKKITDALEDNNYDLLSKYDEIFSNMKISSSKKNSMAELAKMNAPYQHLLNDAITDNEAKEACISVLNEKHPLPNPLAKFNDPERLRQVYGNH
jgi:hypothetical protein